MHWGAMCCPKRAGAFFHVDHALALRFRNMDSIQYVLGPQALPRSPFFAECRKPFGADRNFEDPATSVSDLKPDDAPYLGPAWRLLVLEPDVSVLHDVAHHIRQFFVMNPGDSRLISVPGPGVCVRRGR